MNEVVEGYYTITFKSGWTTAINCFSHRVKRVRLLIAFEVIIVNREANNRGEDKFMQFTRPHTDDGFFLSIRFVRVI